jgi:glutamate synthase (NADPH/NADH) small chain
VGEELPADRLRAGCDALVVATGAPVWRELAVPGVELDGIWQAMEYLPAANRAPGGDRAAAALSAAGRRVVVVGGGDTAADCVGTAVRQGARSVWQLDIRPRPPARRGAAQPWPVHARVWHADASQEEAGVLYADGGDARSFAATTIGFEDDGSGRVGAVRLARAAVGSRAPVPGSERRLEADLVLLALGFTGAECDSALVRQLGLPLAGRGTLARDRAFASGVEGVFVAGDAGRGPSLIVWAIAEGRSAAAAVHHYLTGAGELPAPITAQDAAVAAQDG